MSGLESINTGAHANDGTGDPIRIAYQKINNNFATLSNSTSNLTTTVTSSTTGQIVYRYPANVFTQGQFYISATDTINTQTIQLTAQVSSDFGNIKYTAYGTTILGTPLSNYAMSIAAGNVQIIATPLSNATITHSVSSQIFWANRT